MLEAPLKETLARLIRYNQITPKTMTMSRSRARDGA
jgi:hypothetical protein